MKQDDDLDQKKEGDLNRMAWKEAIISDPLIVRTDENAVVGPEGSAETNVCKPEWTEATLHITVCQIFCTI